MNIKRREFLGRTAGALAGWGAVRLFGRPPSTGLPREGASWPNVAVAAGTDVDAPSTLLESALEGLGGLGRFVKPGQVVAIKPNATWAYPPGTASSTDPELLRSLIDMVRAAGARRVIVMDHCTLDPGTEACLRVNGIGPLLDKLAVETIFPDRNLTPKEAYREIDLPRGRAFSRLGVIRAAVAADVRINLAVAKTHLVTRATMCLKNMMGFLEAPAGLHADLDRGIADLNTPSPIQAQLHILEALRVRLPVGRKQAGGNETEFSHPDKIKRLNEIVVGTDPVLVDSYGAVQYFAFKLQELPFITRAYDAGVGEMDAALAAKEGRLRTFALG